MRLQYSLSLSTELEIFKESSNEQPLKAKGKRYPRIN